VQGERTAVIRGRENADYGCAEGSEGGGCAFLAREEGDGGEMDIQTRTGRGREARSMDIESVDENDIFREYGTRSSDFEPGYVVVKRVVKLPRRVWCGRNVSLCFDCVYCSFDLLV
jgi:hypothetical protein